jgi:hypothetical protein
LQRSGVDSVLFCTTPFVEMARAILRSLGDPGVRIVEVQHPLGDLRPDDVRSRAEAVLPQVDALMETGAG